MKTNIQETKVVKRYSELVVEYVGKGYTIVMRNSSLSNVKSRMYLTDGKDLVAIALVETKKSFSDMVLELRVYTWLNQTDDEAYGVGFLSEYDSVEVVDSVIEKRSYKSNIYVTEAEAKEMNEKRAARRELKRSVKAAQINVATKSADAELKDKLFSIAKRNGLTNGSNGLRKKNITGYKLNNSVVGNDYQLKIITDARHYNVALMKGLR